jgi:murein DD-endopeptidase MepM/ murein hydrolase activator NlpD
MRQLTALLLLLLFVIPIYAQKETETPAPIPRPAASAIQNSASLTLERYFPSLVQGQVGLLHLFGDNVAEARVLFRGREYPFLALNEADWYAFVVADIDAQARDYPISVIAQLEDGTLVNFDDLLTIESGEFVRLNFEVAPNLGYLTNPVLERNEYARLESLIEVVNPERFWSDNGFVLPIETAVTSGFGQYRILNGAVQTRHTGWDQSAPVGTSVIPMAGGEVVFAGQLDIRGNYILINHGWGVYSGYAHLSQINVERSQTVAQGQIMALTGNTGRSGGPHLHWEIAINGEWVDGALFAEMWLP